MRVPVELATLCLAMVHIIVFVADAVRMNSLKVSATNSEVEEEIKHWLKLASEQDGGARARALRREGGGNHQHMR